MAFTLVSRLHQERLHVDQHEVHADFGKASSRGRDTFKNHWEDRTLERAIRCANNANRLFEAGMDGGRRMAYRYWRSRSKHASHCWITGCSSLRRRSRRRSS